MNSGTRAVTLFIAVASVATVARFLLFSEDPPDRTQIQTALKDSLEAGKEGRSGSVIELLARDFEVNGYTPNSSEISRMIKEYKPEITVLTPEPAVDGDRAEIVSTVKMSLKLPIKQDFDIQNVTFAFVKVPSSKWVFVPTKVWKLRRVTLPDDVAAQIGGLTNFGGFGGIRGLGL